jgi:hypothetical protein
VVFGHREDVDRLPALRGAIRRAHRPCLTSHSPGRPRPNRGVLRALPGGSLVRQTDGWRREKDSNPRYRAG